MTIAVAAEGNTPDSQPCQRFARAPWFLIFRDDGAFEGALKTDPVEHGAAASAVELLSRNGVKTVLAPQLGPNAQGALRQAGIKAYSSKAPSAAEAVALYLSGGAESLD
ncbi:MAG: hypothetical protein N2315_00895 [Thermanaerothrix sp.]|nr:hypothetical protein [Thermanaerothrix sp.]